MLPNPLPELGVDLAMAGVEAAPILINVKRLLIAVMLVENEILKQPCCSVGIVQQNGSVLCVG